MEAGIPHSSDDDMHVRHALEEYHRSFSHSQKAIDIHSAVRGMSIYLEEYSSLSDGSESENREAIRKYNESKLYLMNLLETERKKHDSFDVLWYEGVFID